MLVAGDSWLPGSHQVQSAGRIARTKRSSIKGAATYQSFLDNGTPTFARISAQASSSPKHSRGPFLVGRGPTGEVVSVISGACGRRDKAGQEELRIGDNGRRKAANLKQKVLISPIDPPRPSHFLPESPFTTVSRERRRPDACYSLHNVTQPLHFFYQMKCYTLLLYLASVPALAATTSRLQRAALH